MKIPGKAIADMMQDLLKEEVQQLKKKGKTPHLVDILVGESAEQQSFVSIKEKTAHKLGIDFDFVHFKHMPSFQEFAQKLKSYSQNPDVTGIIIQQPLPHQLQTDSIYNFIPLEKEIEAHKNKSPFIPPIGLGVLTALKYVLGHDTIDPTLMVNLDQDANFLKKSLKHKKIVVIGRGSTGGQPIGFTLTKIKINYLSVNSQTYKPTEYYKDADIIITAVGQKVITPEMLKPGVILLNVGLRRENDQLKGDYEDNEVKDIASYYSPTPGGVGPIDVLYLFKNLIDATKLQIKS